jgi:hypothetical protein
MNEQGAVKGKRALVLSVFALGILFFAVALLFGAIIFQEGNPVPVLQALARLELSEEPITRITGADVKYIQTVGPETPLTEYLAAYGWSFRERLGAGIFYQKRDSALFAEARMLTRRYVVYQLDREP